MSPQVLFLLVAAGVTTLSAQARNPAPAEPVFEVASVKPWVAPSAPVTSVVVPALPARTDRFNRTTTVAGLILYAYDLQDHQLTGGENWTRTERFEIAARAGREVASSSD